MEQNKPDPYRFERACGYSLCGKEGETLHHHTIFDRGERANSMHEREMKDYQYKSHNVYFLQDKYVDVIHIVKRQGLTVNIYDSFDDLKLAEPSQTLEFITNY